MSVFPKSRPQFRKESFNIWSLGERDFRQQVSYTFISRVNFHVAPRRPKD